jgi:Protein of unknown function (DUF1214)
MTDWRRSFVAVSAVCAGLLSSFQGMAQQATATAWPAYTDTLSPYVEHLPGLPADFAEPQLRQEFNKWLFAQHAQALFALLYQDPNYPDFWPVYNQAFNFGFPNPDDAYYMTVVDDAGVYKISGFRGTVRILDFQIGSNMMQPYGMGPLTAAELSAPVADYDIDQGVHFGKGGAFEVILSPVRPPGYKGDWWKLEPKATFILVRQRAYDWLHELDGRLAIERLDKPAIKPRPNAQEIEQKLQQTSAWIENWTKFTLNFGVGMRARGLVNKIENIGQRAGLNKQNYIMGMFDIGPDEALILETEIPKRCHYWSFQLTDEMMSAVDPMNRQTNLNGYTAKLDKDGKFRAVISAQDPGVPNWLDTAGYARGAIVGRWWDCSSTPQPLVTKIKVAQVRQSLPAATPVVTAAQRDAAIRLRRTGAQLRRRW